MKSLKDISSSRHEKTENTKDCMPKEKTNKSSKKNISLKLGSFEFHYSKECESHIENVEYLIS